MLATEVPRHVAEVVQRRVARLPAPAAELMSAAAVLGEGGWITLLASAAGLSAEETLERLEPAVRAGLLAEEDPGRWRLTHALVRDALYASLPMSARHRLHHRAAEALARSAASDTAERARHALAALPLGDPAAALSAAAGREAMARLAYEEAADHFGRGLDALETGHGSAADRAELARARPELLTAAALGFADPGADLGIAYRAGDVRTIELLEQGLEHVGPSDSDERVLLLARLAAELYLSSQAKRSRPLAEEAIAAARPLGSEASLVAALAVYHDAYVVGQVHSSEALAGSAVLLRHAQASGDRRALLMAHRARVFDLVTAGDHGNSRLIVLAC